jgi:hypothetical protein
VSACCCLLLLPCQPSVIIKEHFQRTDLLGIPEFSHSAGAYNGNKLAADEGGQLLVPPSPPKGDASGTAAIWLSRRLKPLVVDGSAGSEGSRITFVRIKLETQFIFAICAYIPYWKRGSKTKGLAHQGSEARATLDQMQAVIDARAKPADALVILTDANARLAPTEDGAVGQFCVQKVANSAGKQLLQFMRHNQLTAANTLFRPRRRRRRRRNRYAHPGNVTYRPRGGKNGCDAQIDYGKSLGWESTTELSSHF